MKILGIDTSSAVATAALLHEDRLAAEFVLNNRHPHLEKLISMIDRLLTDSGTELKELDAVAVAVGPGSFTGIRIGMACAQGLSHVYGIPLVGVNTLDALAYNLMHCGDLICPAVDAQRGEVYTCLYRWEEGELKRLGNYEVVKAEKLAERLLKLDEKTILLGDGAGLVTAALSEGLPARGRINVAHRVFAMPRASSVAAAGLKDFLNGKTWNCFSIRPFYMRKSHAEEKWEERYGKGGTGKGNH
ncbi:tRNA (adenosine(37)-N6)-threonylcarbamoyltransferase complex dimerization subunit type 1 TsaB [Thermosediminibacter litoriperuensis]|uniref:tRNA threonylcarbamoyladenosine biosynthesis protein TsaB n=1 Tax=Thermosediminibacter litoriperuensis TaxID=291989 RepID=A0A5S5AR77_9FIRM|nr:tRNA (adenosine(37)-N6)-threonylcarbamoyltransferase complex dimerization subunit type 1 TsaB [Thermosediminibacter litoriperuensis]TYP53315.1 tRNA threonylcarbamoyladenosine biosynthesis protein TsaB [Thermosediminibacter litoriperuensis]